MPTDVADAVRFWEPRRLLYNAVLGVFVVVWLAGTWPHFRSVFVLSSLPRLAVLALIANVLYCAAYLIDGPIRHSASGAARDRRLWGLWCIGTLLAIAVENYWIVDEIYPYVR